VAKKQRRGLGHTLPVHKAALRVSHDKVDRLIDQTAAAVGRGNCKVAFKALAGAAFGFGDLMVHQYAVHGSVTSDANMLNNRYHAVRDDFVKACVRTAPGLAGARRRRKGRR